MKPQEVKNDLDNLLNITGLGLVVQKTVLYNWSPLDDLWFPTYK